MVEKLKNKIIFLLHWSERYTKTDMVYLFKGGFWLTLGQIFSSIAAFAVSVAFANFFPKEIFGVYKYILSIFGILAIFSLHGLSSALTKAFSKGFSGSYLEVFYYRIRWALLGSLVAIITSGYYFLQGNTVLGFSFIIVAAALPFFDSLSIYNSYLHSKKRFKEFSYINAINQIIPAIGLIITIIFFKNVWLILGVYFSFHIILRFIFFKKFNKETTIKEKTPKEVFSYGKHLSLMGVLGTLSAHIDKVLVFQLLGGTELALYTIAIAPIDQIKGFFKNISFLAWPKFAEQSFENIREVLFGKLKKFFVFLTVVITIYILLAPFFFNLFFPTYTQSIIYSQVLAISVIFAILGTIPYAFLESHGSKKSLYTYNIIGNIFSIATLLILIPFYGLWGAIIARFTTRIVSYLLLILLIKKESR